jgi:DNA-binding NarL/FixJ family response regulator
MSAWAAGQALSFDEAIAEALAVRVVSAGVAPASHAAPSSSFSIEPDNQHTHGLSPREQEILARIANGRTNQEIATELDLSIRTVNNHVTSILEKLGQLSRAAAVALAIRLKLI